MSGETAPAQYRRRDELVRLGRALREREQPRALGHDLVPSPRIDDVDTSQ